MNDDGRRDGSGNPLDARREALRAQLLARGERFDFVQAVRLIHHFSRTKAPIGELGPLDNEPLRFRHDPSLAFHSSDVTAIEELSGSDGKQRFALTATFLGLTGATAPLSTYYSEELLINDPKGALRAFYDLFHHRLLSLFYRARTKYRFTDSFRSGGRDPFTRRAMSFVGVDADGAVSTIGLPPYTLLSLAPLLTLPSRSARTLRLVLQRLFPTLRVAVESFIPRRVALAENERTRLGRVRTRLNEDFVIGAGVIDRGGRFRIRIGPVTYEQYEQLIPGGQAFPRLRGVVNQFTRGLLEPELELELDKDSRPGFRLGERRHALLGRNTQLHKPGAENVRMRFVLTDDKELSRPTLVTSRSMP